MASLLSYDADHAYPLYYAVQKRLQGERGGADHNDNEAFQAYAFISSPVAQIAVAQGFAHVAYEREAQKNADQLLQELASLDTVTLQNFIYRMKANILKMQHVHAMEHHHYDDTYPILIEPHSALEGIVKPAFIPSKVIDCDGIDAICSGHKQNFMKQVNQHLALSHEERALYLEHITEVRPITKEDCIKDNLPDILIGQQGVFAKCDLPEHYFLGFYSGVYFDVLTDIVPFHDVMGVGIELYLFGVKGQDVPFISAYRFGNRISLVNSCTNYAGTAEEIAYRLKYQKNCLPMRFKVADNPNKQLSNDPNSFDVNGYVTTRPVKSGEQIFVDYGYNYWRNKTADFTDAAPEDIAQALHKI